MSRMNPEVKSKLCHRLRTTTVPQGRVSLNHEGRMCSLGHLCEMAVEAGVIERKEKGDGHIGYGPVDSPYLGCGPYFCDVYPPESVMRWAGLRGEATSEIVVLNDYQGKTLPEIADFIEEHY